MNLPETSWIERGIPTSAVFGVRHERNRQTLSRRLQSPYAVEYNPWTSKAEIEDALFYRGAIVGGFAQVETLLGEVCIRASILPQYSALRGRFPHTVEKRIRFLRQALEFEPLAPYSIPGLRFLDRFEAVSDLRNLMAHGRMQVIGGIVKFSDFPRSDAGTITARQRQYVQAGLEVLAWRSAKLARAAHRFRNELDRLNLLPPVGTAAV